jgi:hypothetical protein
MGEPVCWNLHSQAQSDRVDAMPSGHSGTLMAAVTKAQLCPMSQQPRGGGWKRLSPQTLPQLAKWPNPSCA